MWSPGICTVLNIRESDGRNPITHGQFANPQGFRKEWGQSLQNDTDLTTHVRGHEYPIGLQKPCNGVLVFGPTRGLT